jgi:ubiquinone/menaquinone biosynthesis C-methylase UbiE
MLVDRLAFSPGMKMLDFGCGRGEMTEGFRSQLIDVVPADSSPEAGECLQVNDVVILDHDSYTLPFSDDEFDIVFSKSVVEHLSDPVLYMKDMVRVLKPGGLLITLTPDWEKNVKIFFDDITHVRPFSRKSITQLHGLLELENIEVFRFRQLPSCWRFRSLNAIAAIVSYFVPPRTEVKFLRWSRELLICGIGRKPIQQMEIAS